MVFVVTDTDMDASANVTRIEVEGEKLTAKGTENVEGLQEAIEEQKVAYVFPYSRFTFDVDLRFVVLCDGAGGRTVEVCLVLSLFDFSPSQILSHADVSHASTPPQPQ
jgi:Mini-chromosome maintenance replisome factor